MNWSNIINNNILVDDIDDWNILMEYVDMIENINLSEQSYSWEMMGTTMNNFEKITFDIYSDFVYVGIDLVLDPSQKITMINIKDDVNKISAVKQAINETINWYKNYTK